MGEPEALGIEQDLAQWFSSLGCSLESPGQL